MKNQRDFEEFSTLERKLEQAFSNIKRIDIGDIRKREIMRKADSFTRRRARRISFAAIASITFAVCIAASMFEFNRHAQPDFSLNSVILPSKMADSNAPIEQLWRKAMESDASLTVQEYYAALCVESDFSASCTNAEPAPIRNITVQKSSPIIVFFPQPNPNSIR